jgi:predicted RNase H-like HicB family nuclease
MKQKVLQYDVVFEREEDGGYSVWVPDLPGCCSQGDTLEEAIEMIKEAMALYLEDADKDEIEQGSIHKDRFIIPVKIATP